jgi:HlyD family secretion protein
MNPSTKRVALALLVLGVVAGGAAVYAKWRQSAALPEGLLQANGRIEGDHVSIASKFAGRVERLLVREGDSVTPGQTLVVLDDTQTGARVEQARAQLTQAEARVAQGDASVSEALASVTAADAALAQSEARVAQARAALTTVDARLRAGRSALEVLRGETAIAVETAEARVDHARAMLAKADASGEQMKREAERMRWLLSRELVDQQRSEQADLAWTAARSELTSAKSALVQAERGLADARLGPQRVTSKEDEVRALEAECTHAAASVREAEASVEQTRAGVGRARATLGQARASLNQANAAREQADAALVEAKSVHGDLTIASPTAGVVMTRMVEAGEVVAAGAPLLDLVDLDRLYLKVFVPEVEIGKLRLGLPARIHADAFPDRAFAATVRYIASRAEFTPKEVQTQDERVKLVYPAKLYLEANPDRRLTPGLPADAVIRWKDGVEWRKPRW